MGAHACPRRRPILVVVPARRVRSVPFPAFAPCHPRNVALQEPSCLDILRGRAVPVACPIRSPLHPQRERVRGHVLRNLREAAERVLDAHRAQGQDITLPEATDRVPPVRRSRHEQVARQARREQRRERYAAVRALHAQGMPLLQIARHLQMGRATVRRYVTADVFPERAPHRRQPSHLLPYVAYLERRWAEGCHDGVRPWKDIQAQGFGGSRRMVAQWVCQRRQEPAPTTPHKYRRAIADGPVRTLTEGCTPRRASSRRLVWLLLRDPATLTRVEQGALTQVHEQCPAAATAYSLVQAFVRMVGTRTPSAFALWLDARAQSDLPALQTFAEGLKQDEQAILAALTLPWSNGPLEGFVNKIKTIKRQMYGRGSFPMLRQRVLLAA